MNSFTSQDGQAKWYQNTGAEKIHNTLVKQQCMTPSVIRAKINEKYLPKQIRLGFFPSPSQHLPICGNIQITEINWLYLYPLSV